MQITDVVNSLNDPNIVLKCLADDIEFRQLRGYLKNLCVFAIDTIDIPAKVTKTGARHNHAKWLLLPVFLRKRYRTDEYDFDDIKCNCLDFDDRVFFVYMLKKGKD